MEPKDQLHLFQVKSDELGKCNLVANDVDIGFTLSFNQIAGFETKERLPNKADVDQLVYPFRQFVLQNDLMQIEKIYNLCHIYLTSEKLKNFLIKSRAIWIDSKTQAGFSFVANGKELSPWDIADLLIYGYYFHNDEEKIKLYKELSPIEVIPKVIFITYICKCARQVVYVGNVVREAFRDNHFDFTR